MVGLIYFWTRRLVTCHREIYSLTIFSLLRYLCDDSCVDRIADKGRPEMIITRREYGMKKTILLFLIALLSGASGGFPQTASIALDKTSAQVNEPLLITVANANDPCRRFDWIGLYEADVAPSGKPPAIWYAYLRDAGVTAGTGTLSFHPARIPDKQKERYKAGVRYKFVLAFDDKYEVRASSEFTVNDGTRRVIIDYDPVMVTVAAGTMPVLPRSVTARFSDGSGAKRSVVWNTIDPARCARAGSFTVRGITDGAGLMPAAQVTIIEGGGPLLRFQVISDTHVHEADPGDTNNARLKNALADLRNICPESDALCMVGDLTESGSEAQYDSLMSILGENRHPALYMIPGNHDLRRHSSYRKAEDLFVRKTGMPACHYDTWIKGFHFIFLSSEERQADISSLPAGQLAWLEDKLSERAVVSRPIFVFHHQPLGHTVPLTEDKDGYGSSRKDGIEQDRELKELFSRYPQVIFFTGHTHMPLTSPGNLYNANYCTMVNDSAITTIWRGISNGSQGLSCDVYADKVLIKGRDFLNREWLVNAQFAVRFTQKGPVLKTGPHIRTDREIYSPGEDIKVYFYNGPGYARDWIGLYHNEASNSKSIAWQYVSGSRTPSQGMKTGVIIFKGGLPGPGQYDIRFFIDESHEKICDGVTIKVK